MPSAVLRALALIAVLALGATACADDGGGTAADAGAVDGAVGPTAELLGGGELEWASLAGQDAVLWFWAPWCTVCRAEADDVVAAAAALDGRVQVVGVAGRDDVDAMEGFLADTGTGGLPHVVDGDGAIWQAYGVSTQPSFAFVDDDGRIEVVVGALGEAALTERMEALAAT